MKGPIGSLAELSKARLNALVVVTTGIGFVMASGPAIDWVRCGWTVLGTALAAASSGILNQLAEHRRDALMERTRERPLPAGRIRKATAFVLGVALGYAGPAILAAKVDLGAAGLALGNILLYVLIYTPLKPRTTLNTLVGAVCGAVPPMIGAIAAEGRLGAAAWVLATILFVWQLPHFLALAWMYREDYRRGGFAMLPVLERDERTTPRVALGTALCTVSATLLGFVQMLAGAWYLAAAVFAGGWLCFAAYRFLRAPTHASARGLFLATLLHLPVVLGVMAMDRIPHP